MWALALWKHDCLAHSHQEFCRTLWRPSSVVDLREWRCVGAQGPSGIQASKLLPVPAPGFRPGSTPWALHPLVVAEGDAPEFLE